MLYDIKQVQEIETKMLKEIVAICDRNNIQYYGAVGTCLGAVRHGDTIPWDDDVDIVMPFSQVERFVECANRELPKEYYLDYYKTKKGSYRKFPRIGLNGYKSNILHVDVFVLIGMPNEPKEQNNIINEFRDISKLNNIMKRKGISLVKELRFKDLYLRYKYRNNKQIANDMFSSLCEKYPFEDYELCAMATSHINNKSIHKSDLFGKGYKHKYNDFEITIPEKYDEYLTVKYGNYMEFPSQEHIDAQMKKKYQVDKL